MFSATAAVRLSAFPANLRLLSVIAGGGMVILHIRSYFFFRLLLQQAQFPPHPRFALLNKLRYAGVKRNWARVVPRYKIPEIFQSSPPSFAIAGESSSTPASAL